MWSDLSSECNYRNMHHGEVARKKKTRVAVTTLLQMANACKAHSFVATGDSAEALWCWSTLFTHRFSHQVEHIYSGVILYAVSYLF
jgi:hypothetical protein